MGKRGTKPKPTALKVLEGNPGKRPLNKDEPKPKPIMPPCPEWLHEDAKREWERISPELEQLGLLTVVDMAALSGYCESWAQYKKAIEFLHKHGETYPIKDENGKVKYIQQFPQVSIANKALQNIKAFCAEFGLTPSSRSRMIVPGADNRDDDTESLLSGVR